jgi:hypothetical protein
LGSGIRADNIIKVNPTIAVKIFSTQWGIHVLGAGGMGRPARVAESKEGQNYYFK